MVYWLHVMASFAMRFVPVRLAYRLVGWGTPLVLQMFARGHLERAMTNMQQVLGPDVAPGEAKRITREAFANYARYMVDLVRMPHLNPAEMLANVRIEGWEHVEDAFNRGKGVV